MKCFTIKSGNEYVADVSRVITSSYYDGKEINTVDCIDEAKHYRNSSVPKAWLNKTLFNIKDELLKSKKELKEAKSNNSTSYYIKDYQAKIDKAKKILNWLNKANVIKLDIEVPNFASDLKLRWNRWRKNDRSSKMQLCKQTHSRYYCKACGVVLKNIPYYELPLGNSTKVCVACLYLRLEAIKTAFEGMPEDFRTSFINELVLGSL